MTSLVIDASVALKWLLAEPDAQAAMSLRRQYHLIAPELLLLECANAFWKRVRRGQLTVDEARLLADAIPHAGIEIVSSRGEAGMIANLALELDHPAYDCAYIALALTRQCLFATADCRLVAAVRKTLRSDVSKVVVAFADLVDS